MVEAAVSSTCASTRGVRFGGSTRDEKALPYKKSQLAAPLCVEHEEVGTGIVVGIVFVVVIVVVGLVSKACTVVF